MKDCGFAARVVAIGLGDPFTAEEAEEIGAHLCTRCTRCLATAHDPQLGNLFLWGLATLKIEEQLDANEQPSQDLSDLFRRTREAVARKLRKTAN